MNSNFLFKPFLFLTISTLLIFSIIISIKATKFLNRNEMAIVDSNLQIDLQANKEDLICKIRESETFKALKPIHKNMLLNNMSKKKSPLLNLFQACWTPDSDYDDLLSFYENEGGNLATSLGLIPGLEGPQWEFDDSDRWTITATNGGGLGQGDPTILTWSIVPDGTSIYGYNGEPTSPSNLIAMLDGLYGNTGGSDLTQREWFPLFEDIWDRWSELTGFSYVYEPEGTVSDWTSNTIASGQLGVRGDIRISGHSIDGQSGSNVLAYNFFPNFGDMVIDTDNTALYGITTNNSRLLRNVLSHEHGHGLGLNHTCPVNGTKLMEPFINSSFDGPQLDDILGANRGYGDNKEPNDSFGSATSQGVLVDGITKTVTDIGIDDDADIDFIAFTTTSSATVSITLSPVGTTYTAGPQVGDCNTGTSFNAAAQSDLSLQLLSTNGTTNIITVNSTGAGSSEVITAQALPAGASTYFIKISGAANTVQLYDLSITVNHTATCPSISTQPTPNSTVCQGEAVSLSVGISGGTSPTYQWQSSSTSGNGFSNIGSATNATYTPPTSSTGTTYYWVIISDSGCSDITSNEAAVIVNADPSISSQPVANTNVCVGGTATLSVVAAGGINKTYQWQSSSSSGSGFSNIGSATNTSYTVPTGSPGTTYYRVVISDSGTDCDGIISSEAAVTVNADPSINSQPTASTNVCLGGTATLSVVAIGGINKTYQWQSSSSSGSGFANIGSATSASYTVPTGSTGIMYYRVVISDSGTGCDGITSSEAAVTVNADPSINSQPTASTNVCLGGTATLSVVATGGINKTYQWQSSSSSGSGFANIGSATSASYTVPTGSTGIMYYRVVISDNGTGCDGITSNEAEVIVNADPSISSQPVASTNVCVGGTATLSVVATGGINKTYQWQSSSSSGSGFANIGSATNTSYAVPTGSPGTTYYRVVISDSGTGCDGITSNEAEVIVNADPSISSQPVASTNVCEGGAVSLSVVATGGINKTYQWQSSSSSGSGFANIGSATNTSYAVPTGSPGTTYYRVVISDSGTGCDGITSNEAAVNISADPSISSQPIASTNVCEGGSLTLSVVATGGINKTYQWQSSSSSGSGFSNIGSATNTSYTVPTGSPGIMYYRVIISDSGTGCDGITSSEAVVTVNADPSISTQPTASTNVLCVGGTATLSVVATGGINKTYQWQSSSSSGSGFANIGSATNTSYTVPTGSTGTMYYRVVISDSGTGCDGITSSEAVVTVNADPSINTQPTASTNVCEDGAVSLSVVATGGTSLTYQWQSSSTSGSGFSNIGSATSASYTVPTGSTGTMYYRVIISDSGTGCDGITSSEAAVTVNADPSINTQPIANTNVCEDGAVSLSVDAAGGTSLTYQWQSSSTSGSGFSNIGSATNDSYTVPTGSTGIMYYQIVISDSGTGCDAITSSEAMVTVNADPSISTQPVASTNVCEDGAVSLSVDAAGGTSLTYQWQSSSTSGSGFSNIGSATSASYPVPTGSPGIMYYQVVISDSGTGCDAITSNEVMVTVNADPSINTQPVASTNVCEDGAVSLSVDAAGGTSLTYQWQSSSTSGSGFSNIGSATNDSYTVPTGSTGIMYYQVVINDSGTGCDAITSSEAVVNVTPNILTVIDNPAVNIYAAVQTITTSGTVNVTGTATFKAGTSITLTNGFHAKANSNFLAIIENCPVAFNEEVAQVSRSSNEISIPKPIKKSTKKEKFNFKIAPNPFRNATKFSFDLESATKLTIAVFDLNGQIIEKISQNESFELGWHEINYSLKSLKSGMFYVVIRGKDFIATKKMVRLR